MQQTHSGSQLTDLQNSRGTSTTVGAMQALHSQPAVVFRVAVLLPPFWAELPAMLFSQAKTQLSLASISNEKSKFYFVISQLDYQYTAEVEDIITLRPSRTPTQN
jgi:hypothetical protein